MLASIFSKVTASLGKTYVYSGLLPAGVLILVIASYLLSVATLSQLADQLLTAAESWKSLAWLGAAWIAGGFLFYAIRAPLFSMFQFMPSSTLGRFLLFRRIANRERLRRERITLEWQSTAINWLTQLNLDRAAIGDLPSWLMRSFPGNAQALTASGTGREALVAVARTEGDALNLEVWQSDAIARGIFSLYRLALYPRPPDIETAFAAEIAAWRFAAARKEAKAVIESVNQDCQRKIAKAFRDCERYGQGPYVFPTSLGNLISALDDYGLQRYGIDTATIWDRLWWVLPKDVKAEVSDARLALETLLNLCLSLGVATAVILAAHVDRCGVIPVLGGPCDVTRAAVFAAGPLVLAALVYRGATFAMEVLSVKTTSLIDMYRIATLRQLGFSPKTVGEERALSAGLKGLFTQAATLDDSLRLEGAKSAASASEQAHEKPAAAGAPKESAED